MDKVTWWKQREINWEQDYLLADGALNHPHRDQIVRRLSELQWRSLLEAGMGAGANLVRIKKQWPSAELGGFDVNLEAVKVASKYIKGRYMDVADVRDIFLSDKSVDIVMTDAVLLYLSKREARKALKEMQRVARRYLLLCELHSDKKVWFSKYKIHNYNKLLEDNDCFNIQIEKIKNWPGTPWEQWGHLITAEFI